MVVVPKKTTTTFFSLLFSSFETTTTTTTTTTTQRERERCVFSSRGRFAGGPIREREREKEREKKKNGILGNDVRVRRPRRRVRGVHQRHGHSRREPPETRALDNGGDVHVDDVGDNIHGADVSAGTAGEE